MKLHLDSDGFTVLFNMIGDSTGIRSDILEKVYKASIPFRIFKKGLFLKRPFGFLSIG